MGECRRERRRSQSTLSDAYTFGLCIFLEQGGPVDREGDWGGRGLFDESVDQKPLPVSGDSLGVAHAGPRTDF